MITQDLFSIIKDYIYHDITTLSPNDRDVIYKCCNSKNNIFLDIFFDTYLLSMEICNMMYKCVPENCEFGDKKSCHTMNYIFFLFANKNFAKTFKERILSLFVFIHRYCLI